MGVPRFYRWLSERYPLINQAVGMGLRPEFDCLYLDMNGIVHNCTHANGGVKVRLTESQMFQRIFQYIDKLFNIVCPKKLIYLAIDGVAPRAKMNQQRQRRFRSAQAAQEARELALQAGETLEEDPFDSNCITPGTPFMERLSAHIQYFVRGKIRDDPKWQGIKVIFSGAESVGEGEHKIMAYMRAERMQPDYNPNMRHVFYGLDADLIMLSLLSHEHHIALLREEVIFGAPKEGVKRKTLVKPDEFQFLHLGVLREYFELEFRNDNMPFPFDLERVIDDFVFLCYLVGNDFLPGLPTLDIADGGLNTLFDAYKELLPYLGGYITHWGSVNLMRFKAVLSSLAQHEDAVFERMADEQARWGGTQAQNPVWAKSPGGKGRSEAKSSKAAEKLLELEEGLADEGDDAFDFDALDELSDEEEVDLEMLAGDLNPRNYYLRKFPEFYPGTEAHESLPEAMRGRDTADYIQELCVAYYEGLCWCYKYYYAGVQSWRWHYLYRFAPLASSLVDIDVTTLRFDFDLGEPFKPLEQLMGVLPPGSAKLLPAGLRGLMTSGSSIKEYYPDEFDVDMNGKRNSWEGIALIPFIEEKRLLGAMQALGVDALTAAEKKRNVNAQVDLLFSFDPSVHETYDLASGYSTTVTLVGSDPDAAVGRSITVAPVDELHPTDAAFPPLRDCMSRVTGYRTPLIPTTPHFVTEEQRATLALLDAADAYMFNLHYGHYSPSSSTDTVTARRAPEGRYLPIRLPGAIKPLPGFPSLLYLRGIESSLQKGRINLFGRATMKPSLILRAPTITMERAQDPGYVVNTFRPGSVVYCDYPYIREGLIARVQDDAYVWCAPTRKGGKIVGRAATQVEKAQYQRAMEDVTRRLREKQGVEIGHARVLVFVRPLVGVGSNPDGSVYKSFAPEDYGNYTSAGAANSNPTNYNNNSTDIMSAVVRVAAYPPQLLWNTHPTNNPDVRWAEKPAPSPQETFPVGKSIVYVGPGMYGSTGVVSGHKVDENGKFALSLRLTSRPLPLFQQFRDLVQHTQLHYFPAQLLSQQLSLHPAVLARITSSLIVEPGRIDIGLNLKFARHSLHVPDYVRRVDAWQTRPPVNSNNGDRKAQDNNRYSTFEERGTGDQWEYSELAATVLHAYMTQFPEIFAMLNSAPNANKYNLAHITGSAGTASELLKRVGTFLQSLAVSHLIALPCSSLTAPMRTCLLIEDNLRRIAEMEIPPVDIPVEDVDPVSVYSPNATPAWSPTSPLLPTASGAAQMVLGGQALNSGDVSQLYNYSLGDRVLSLRSDEGVAVGAEGTVVGVHGNFAEVIFDRVFPTGDTLQGKCREHRGKIVSVYSLLNLSNPKPMFRADVDAMLATATASAAVATASAASAKAGVIAVPTASAPTADSGAVAAGNTQGKAGRAAGNARGGNNGGNAQNNYSNGYESKSGEHTGRGDRGDRAERGRNKKRDQAEQYRPDAQYQPQVSLKTHAHGQQQGAMKPQPQQVDVTPYMKPNAKQQSQQQQGKQQQQPKQAQQQQQGGKAKQQPPKAATPATPIPAPAPTAPTAPVPSAPVSAAVPVPAVAPASKPTTAPAPAPAPAPVPAPAPAPAAQVPAALVAQAASIAADLDDLLGGLEL